MKIAIVNNLYEPFARGGAERIAKLQFEGLLDSDYKVITISLKPYGIEMANSKEHFYINSIFPSLNKLPKFLRLFWHIWDTFNFVNYFKIKKILKAAEVDTVITHNMTGIGKLSLLHVSKKYRHLHVLHDIALLHPSGLMFYKQELMIDGFFASRYQKINRAFLKYVETVISPSRWLLDLHVSKGFFTENTKTNFLPNPLKANSDPGFAGAGNDFTFLYVGLIAKSKGVDVLLDAFTDFNENGKKIKLVLIGKLIDSELQEIIDKNSSVDYIGELKHEEIMHNMKISNCLIMPSVCYENSPTVIYEAISQGLTVISSEIGGATELIEKFGGLLFEPGNSFVLRAHMKYAIKNSTKMKNKVKLSKSIIKLYNLESYILSLEDIINYQENH